MALAWTRSHSTLCLLPREPRTAASTPQCHGLPSAVGAGAAGGAAAHQPPAKLALGATPCPGPTAFLSRERAVGPGSESVGIQPWRAELLWQGLGRVVVGPLAGAWLRAEQQPGSAAWVRGLEPLCLPACTEPGLSSGRAELEGSRAPRQRTRRARG